MFKHIGLALMSAASMIAGAATIPAQAQNEIMKLGSELQKHRRHKGKGQNNRRGKGKVSRPAKRRNLVTHGKRVRRKHRRAA